MKKLLFLAVSAILAGASYCSSVSEKIVAKVTNSDTQIEQSCFRLMFLLRIALIVRTIRVDKMH